MATINDVAKLAGVSKGTVSSVFSKKRPISREVTERVLEAAKNLGYFPNHVARSLAMKKTMIAGLKMPVSRDSSMSGFEIQMVNGVMKECSKHGYRVLLDTLPEHDDPTQFSSDPVDGVIMLNPRKEDPRIVRYGQMGIPLVLVGRPDPQDETVCYADNNNRELGGQVGDYLLQNGHTAILFLNAGSDMTVSFDRRTGLTEAFRRHGVSMQQMQVMNYSRKVHGNPTEYGYIALKSLQVQAAFPFTAVIADTDRVAVGVLRAAAEMGIDVPGQLSVIALSNDATLAQLITPQLTSVGVHQRIVDAKLVIRDSCAILIKKT